MRYLLIKNNSVVNSIEAESDFISTLTGYDYIIPSEIGGIGYSYINEELVSPEITVSGSISILNLTKLEFLRRFTVEERINIRSSVNPIIADFMELLNLADNIRLDDPDILLRV